MSTFYFKFLVALPSYTLLNLTNAHRVIVLYVVIMCDLNRSFIIYTDGNLLKRTIEIKRRLTDVTNRENKITYYEDDDDCSSESDMEEVPSTVSADDLLARCLLPTTATQSANNDVSIMYM